MITGIRTTNYRRLKKFEANFTDGTNLLFGENAEGKSSLFEAIRFALFGLRATEGTAEDIVTRGESGGLSVELDIMGYTFRRTLSGCRVKDADGETIADGNTPSTRFAEKLLGCTFKDFDLLYMSKQGESAALITYGAAELNRKVEEYAGVTAIDKIIKSLGSDAHGLRIALDNFEYQPVEEMETRLAGIEAAGSEAKTELETIESAKSGKEKEQTELQAELTEATNFNQQQDAIANSRKDADAKLNRLTAEKDAAEKELNKVNAEFADAKEVSDADIDKVREDLNLVRETSKQLLRLTTEDSILAKIKEAETKLEAEQAYAVALPGFEQAEESAERAFNKANDTHKEHLREYNTASKQEKEGVCSECGRALEDHDPEAARNAVMAAAELVSKSKATLEIAKDNLDSAKKALRDHNQTNPGTGHQQELDRLNALLEEVKAKRVELEGKLSNMVLEDTLQETLSNLVSDQKTWKSVSRRLDDSRTEFGVVSNNLENAQAELAQLKQPRPKIDITDINNKLAAVTSDINMRAGELAQASAKRSSLVEQYRSLKSELEAAKANNTKMAEMSEELKVTNDLRKYLNDERVKFMDGIWRTILGTATHFVNKVTLGRITAIGRNDKGDFTFTEYDNETVAKSNASGAQKAFIGTALKIGLAQAKMGSNSILLLDEPTADMRDANAAQLASGLMMLPGQKVMITHRDSERMVAQNIIQVGQYDK